MIPVKVLAVRYLANASPALASGLGAPEGYPSLGLLTTDCIQHEQQSLNFRVFFHSN